MKLLISVLLLFIIAGCARTNTLIKKDTKINKVVKSDQQTPKTETPRPKPIDKPKLRSEIRLLYPVRGGTISSPFDYRKNYFHRGVDIAAPLGAPVLASSDGIVRFSGRHKILAGYGNSILLRHHLQAGRVFTYYAHLNELSVKRGEVVKEGDTIGKVGNTGKSRGYHLHHELIINGKNHNPVPYYFSDKSILSQVSKWLEGVKKNISTSKALKFIVEE